jgi:hypothetical protein
VPYLRESLELLTEFKRPPTDPTRLNTERHLSLALCSTGAPTEGEALARGVVARLGAPIPRLMQARARAGLGFCLQRLGRLTEAEPLLLEAAQAFEALPTPSGGLRLQTVAHWLEALYAATGRPTEAATWRARQGTPAR